MVYFHLTGGGYHGKSTILNAMKAGIYNKIPGDGREFVVTNSSAVAIRSEDGRYVSGILTCYFFLTSMTKSINIINNSIVENNDVHG